MWCSSVLLPINVLVTCLSSRDINEIRDLQYKYGYYLDKCHYNEIVACFAVRSDTTLAFHGGIWKGIEGVKRLYHKRLQERCNGKKINKSCSNQVSVSGGHNGPVQGFLSEHPQHQSEKIPGCYRVLPLSDH